MTSAPGRHSNLSEHREPSTSAPATRERRRRRRQLCSDRGQSHGGGLAVQRRENVFLVVLAVLVLLEVWGSPLAAASSLRRHDGWSGRRTLAAACSSPSIAQAACVFSHGGRPPSAQATRESAACLASRGPRVAPMLIR